MSLELIIEKTAYGGEGIAHHDGKTCFVEGALPGERVLVEITQDKKNFIKARTLKISEPSRDREKPPCLYYGHCGGCQYQHVSYAAELTYKEAQVREILERSLGPAVSVGTIRYVKEPYGYRNSATVHTGLLGKKHVPYIGFVSRDNRTVLPVRKCLLLDERLNVIFGGKISADPRKLPEKITFRLDVNGQIYNDQEDRFYRVRVGEQLLVSNARGFFQNHLSVAHLLARQAAEWIRQLKPGVFFDLYAGVGLFSFAAAPGVPFLVAVEENPASIEALRMNAQESGRPASVKIVTGNVERAFPDLWRECTQDDPLIFLDPPRQGVRKEFIEFLAREVRKGSMIYVSCDPVTAARDLKTLLEGGYFKKAEVIPFDMFPRTKHLEIAARLSP